jgi:F-box and leucine-rich repeat protein 2/20
LAGLDHWKNSLSNCKRIGQFDLLMLGAGWMKLWKFEIQIRGSPNVCNPHDPSYVAHNQYRYDFFYEGLKDLTLVRFTVAPEIGLHCLLSKCRALEKLYLNCVLGLKG